MELPHRRVYHIRPEFGWRCQSPRSRFGMWPENPEVSELLYIGERCALRSDTWTSVDLPLHHWVKVRKESEGRAELEPLVAQVSAGASCSPTSCLLSTGSVLDAAHRYWGCYVTKQTKSPWSLQSVEIDAVSYARLCCSQYQHCDKHRIVHMCVVCYRVSLYNSLH